MDSRVGLRWQRWSGFLVFVLLLVCSQKIPAAQGEENHLPGTEPLEWSGDLAQRMVQGIDRFLTRETARSVQERKKHWRRDFSSWAAYEESVEANRERFRQRIGAVDERLPFEDLERVATTSHSALRGEDEAFSVYAVRWPVFAGVEGEGLLLQPKGPVRARAVVLPDADQNPEDLMGWGSPGTRPWPGVRVLAEEGCQVVIPVLVDRRATWSGNRELNLWTNQLHREWIYRQAFQLGRHVIGYEVQKVLAVVDWFARQDAGEGKTSSTPVGVAGYGEGGLIAFYSAAVDPRIDTVLVSGYFDSREQVWQEPIYRNVFGLLEEFGDAEIASLVAPRRLILEHCSAPRVDGPPEVEAGRRETAAPGRLSTPSWESVQREFQRFLCLFPPELKPAADLVRGREGEGPGRSALERFGEGLGLSPLPEKPGILELSGSFSSEERQRRQVRQLEEYSQTLLRQSERVRESFWQAAAEGESALQSYRDFYWEEILGRFPPPSLPANPRSRLLYDLPRWKGYEVVLDVWPAVFAYGILLVPAGLRPGERRPVVVCQHGLEGRPQDVVHPFQDTRAYHSFGARLAERGFVVFAPQNPYIGGEAFRNLNRKANPLKKTFFGVIVRQHERILDWLQTLPFVDPQRIGLYGLSYGGVTAMRLPPLLPRYRLSICSANFNDWVEKIGTTLGSYSYLYHHEFEMFGEFDVANHFNYAELAAMIAPRPFMVERGHQDRAGTDEQVAYEYAKVRRWYMRLGIPGRTRIEFFEGGHEIHGRGTFEFLHEHLQWPAP